MTDNQELNKVWFDLENARWTLSQAADLIACESKETKKRAEVTLYALCRVLDRLENTRSSLSALVALMRSEEGRKALEEMEED